MCYNFVMNPEFRRRRQREHRKFDPQKDLGKVFIKYFKEKVPNRERDWMMDILIAATVDERNEQNIAKLTIIPQKNGFEMLYFATNETKTEKEYIYEAEPSWSVKLASNGEFSDFTGIKSAEFIAEMGLLVDPNSSSIDPKFKTTTIQAGSTGVFDLKEYFPMLGIPQGEFFGTVKDQGVHIRGYKVRFLDELTENK
jgi:hypothetical protein